MKIRRIFTAGILLMIVLLLVAPFTMRAENVSQERYLMRFPDAHGDTVVFVCGEDIWKASINGGAAVRLTSNEGQERYPKFSPDGKLIAFTGDYDGNTDVYVMNADGGKITRLTYHPDADTVVGWNPVKNKIMFRSGRKSYNRFERLFMVSPDGTGLETLILHEATAGSFSPDGKKIVYTRIANEDRTWKRYRGGRAQDIYMYDFETGEDKKITNFNGTESLPMWIGDKIYFNSDRDNVLNIHVYDPKTGNIEQITHHTAYDALRPSDGIDQIVYELGGEIWLLDLKTKQTRLIPIEVRPDAPETRPYFKKVDEFITNYDISPEGDRAIIIARGEVFTAPKKNGPIRNLTQSSGARDKDAVWSPDGKTIAYISDKSGEYEIYTVDPQGKTEAMKLTQHKNGYRHTLRWSPDSKKIAFADQTLRLYYLDIQTKKITEADHAENENVDVSLDLKPIFDFAWSPDSRYLAYTKMDADLVNKIYIYSLETGKVNGASSGLYNDFGPVFSPDGEQLFFISNRCFSPTFCDFEWEMVYKNIAGVFCLTLKKEGKPLFPLKSNEGEIAPGKVKEDDDDEDDDSDDEDEKKKENVRVVIDFDGLTGRIEKLPLEPGNYRNLAVNDKSVFYLNSEKGDYNQFEFREFGPRNLYSFSIKKQKEKELLKEIDGYKLSADGSTLVYKKSNSIGIIKANSKKPKDTPLDLSDLKMYLEPLKEWRQIFDETWRMSRDFYYEPNMKGIDWLAMKKKYGELVSYASCRQDIRFLIGESIGELSTSHTYIRGGDLNRQAKAISVGMLGADYVEDPVNKRYKFEKIYRAPDWSRNVIPPLFGPGALVEEGDYLLAIDGKPVTTEKEIYSYFQGLAGKQVTLRVNTKPTDTGAREIIVKPIDSETRVRYCDWVESNRLKVEKESNGQIGYIHFADTYESSAIDFPKYFYSQLRKKGIIVDGRFNGGGLDPDIFLGRLDKKIRSYWTRRYSHDQTGPTTAVNAHLVCLTNLYAGSGGDELPWLFRERKMGPVIGTRTWGGLVGTSMSIPLIDGADLNAPDYRIYNPDGDWIIENIGVVPDIEVDLNPGEVARGYDAQLMKGIDVLKEKLKQDPKPWPQHQPFPVEDLKK